MEKSPETSGGLVLIPDITGFTEFVNEVELLHGQHITAELLDNLCNNDQLGMELADMEGDALLLFRTGPRPPLGKLMRHVIHWFEQFHIALRRMRREIFCTCGACQVVSNLSLKVVGHYGEFAIQSIGGRTRIFGPTVILPHRLLKNHLDVRDYFLFTEAVLEDGAEAAAGDWALRGHEETYPVFGQVPLRYFNLGPYITKLPPAEPLDSLPSLPGSLRFEVDIAAPFHSVVDHIVDLEKWKLWLEGLKRVEYDRTHPARKGMPHQCYLGNQVLHQTLEQVTRKEKQFELALRVQPPNFMLKELWIGYNAEWVAGKVHVGAGLAYAARPLMGALVEWMAIPMLSSTLRQSLLNLKGLLEEANP